MHATSQTNNATSKPKAH